MSACNQFSVPVWALFISLYERSNNVDTEVHNTTEYFIFASFLSTIKAQRTGIPSGL